MRIHTLALGQMKNLIYILEDEDSGHCAVVDPAWDVPAIIDVIKKHGLNLQKILLTHCHFDHIEGLEALLSFKSVPVYASSIIVEQICPKLPTMQFVNDNEQIKLGHTVIECKHTPGHSADSQCFYSAPHLIAGDTVFINGCGRCDFDSSNPEHMFESLTWVKSLPSDTLIYPGHDYARKQCDTVENQKITNRFLRCDTLDDFISERMS